VDIRLNGLAGLTHLHGIGHPSGVHNRACSADRSVEQLRELAEHGERLRAFEAAATRNDGSCPFELRALNRDVDALNDLHLLRIGAAQRRYWNNRGRASNLRWL